MQKTKLLISLISAPLYISILWIGMLAVMMLTGDRTDIVGAYFFQLFGFVFYIIYGFIYFIVALLLIFRGIVTLPSKRAKIVFILQPVLLGIIFLLIPAIMWFLYNVVIVGV